MRWLYRKPLSILSLLWIVSAIGSIAKSDATSSFEAAVEGVRNNINHEENSSCLLDSTADSLARSVTLSLVWVVSFQAFFQAMLSHRDRLFEIASKFMRHDTISAARTIKTILTTVDDHGIVDVWKRHEPKQIIASIYALSRLQAACERYERENHYDETINNNDIDETLLEDLLHCAPFAIAAYGWKLDLATAGKLHRGDRQALVKMTNTPPSDIVTVNWTSRPNRPAFYITRDRKRKRIVLAIRGTWSAHDVLTDLCCTPEDYCPESSSLKYRAHNGMLEAARGVAALAKETVTKELNEHPDFSLLLVGHSLGGSVAAIIGTLWGETFSNITVYGYGSACVSPLYDRGSNEATIISILLEGDPFSCLSLGHVADVSFALDFLCGNPDLRATILMRTDGPMNQLESRDLEWCFRTMEDIHEKMVGEKLYPPGKLLFLKQRNKKAHRRFEVREVPPSFFRYWKISPFMFDLSRHVPRLYESSLRRVIAELKRSKNSR